LSSLPELSKFRSLSGKDGGYLKAIKRLSNVVYDLIVTILKIISIVILSLDSSWIRAGGIPSAPGPGSQHGVEKFS
jgi:hypothetical protein